MTTTNRKQFERIARRLEFHARQWDAIGLEDFFTTEDWLRLRNRAAKDRRLARQLRAMAATKKAAR